MKILYIITKSEAGGAQTHVFQLAQHMAGKGNEVAVMAYPGGWLQQELEKHKAQNTNYKQNTEHKTQSINIVFYPNEFFKNSYNLFLGVRAMREIKKAIKEFKPDVVHCHSSVAGFWTRIGIRNKIPTIFTAHGWGFTTGTPFLRKNLVILAEKLAARYSQKIICVSEYDRQLAMKYKITNKDKLTVIHNGVELTRKNAEFYAEKRGNEKCKIVFVGRLAEQKQPELLLEVYLQLTTYNQQLTTINQQLTTNNQQPATNNRQSTVNDRQQTTINQQLKTDTELLIIGDGPKLKNLQQTTKNLQPKLENVKFLGSLPREKVFEILRKSDIFVLTSNWEGFPITILEAMSCGLPIIASDVGGVGEALTPETGRLIPRGDKQALKKALVELIENADLREIMGQNARKRVEQEFSLEKMLEKTEKTYKDCIDFDFFA